jgi:hypothetical protein
VPVGRSVYEVHSLDTVQNRTEALLGSSTDDSLEVNAEESTFWYRVTRLQDNVIILAQVAKYIHRICGKLKYGEQLSPRKLHSQSN